jgi:integrase
MDQKKPGKHYTSDSYRRAIHRACDEAKLERWSPNRLRHSAATEIGSSFGIVAAQVVLGHTTPDTTAIYAERNLDLAKTVIGQIG